MTLDDLLILADEDVDGGIIRSLREHGFLVRAVREEMAGRTDEQVLREAISSQALLITQDKGYRKLVRRIGLPERGIVLVRLPGWASQKKAQIVLRFFQEHAIGMKGKFAVLDHTGYRVARWP